MDLRIELIDKIVCLQKGHRMLASALLPRAKPLPITMVNTPTALGRGC
jgi:hypothetical protein